MKFAQQQLSRLEQPQLEARELVGAFLGLSTAEMIAKDGILLTAEQDRDLRKWLQERAIGIPLAYLTGKKGFFKSEFFVERGVLVPRPETEFVVETALRRFHGKSNLHIADLGCGTGCIGLSLALEWEESKLWAVDASVKACGVAARNATKLGVDERVFILNSRVENWKPKHALNVIVANPPYIPVQDPRVQPSVHQFEPHEALYSGADGLDAIRSWTACAAQWLNRDGLFVLEIGAGQSSLAGDIMQKAGFSAVEVSRDLTGIERILSGVRSYG